MLISRRTPTATWLTVFYLLTEGLDPFVFQTVRFAVRGPESLPGLGYLYLKNDDWSEKVHFHNFSYGDRQTFRQLSDKQLYMQDQDKMVVLTQVRIEILQNAFFRALTIRPMFLSDEKFY